MDLNELFIQGGLYNLNSSEDERRKKIEDILLKTRKDNEENEDDEVIDDDMINQFLRRNEVLASLGRRSMKSLAEWMRRDMKGTHCLPKGAATITIA